MVVVTVVELDDQKFKVEIFVGFSIALKLFLTLDADESFKGSDS